MDIHKTINEYLAVVPPERIYVDLDESFMAYQVNNSNGAKQVKDYHEKRYKAATNHQKTQAKKMAERGQQLIDVDIKNALQNTKAELDRLDQFIYVKSEDDDAKRWTYSQRLYLAFLMAFVSLFMLTGMTSVATLIESNMGPPMNFGKALLLTLIIPAAAIVLEQQSLKHPVLKKWTIYIGGIFSAAWVFLVTQDFSSPGNIDSLDSLLQENHTDYTYLRVIAQVGAEICFGSYIFTIISDLIKSHRPNQNLIKNEDYKFVESQYESLHALKEKLIMRVVEWNSLFEFYETSFESYMDKVKANFKARVDGMTLSSGAINGNGKTQQNTTRKETRT